ncbi:MAG TPA: hypothetical protein VK607_25380, partial [Kofleriaceae bacterium]|nr:hypothetical protein [Kofleriaceae bacterium]
LTAGWTTGTNDSSPSPWVWGVPTGGATDPHAAFSGQHALIQALNGDYTAKSSSFVKMPPIDVGRWSDVHLQYRRWLAVEDSHFDQARISVGGKQAWVNFTQNMGDSSSAQHIDREWRFQDVSVSGYQSGHTIDITWDLSSDEGLQFGGWALDDVCLVANVHSVCGDGVLGAHEACDDGAGNADEPNACRTYCQTPACGDEIVDRGEQCDDGPTGDGHCTSTCQLVGPPSLGGSPGHSSRSSRSSRSRSRSRSRGARGARSRGARASRASSQPSPLRSSRCSLRATPGGTSSGLTTPSPLRSKRWTSARRRASRRAPASAPVPGPAAARRSCIAIRWASRRSARIAWRRSCASSRPSRSRSKRSSKAWRSWPGGRAAGSSIGPAGGPADRPAGPTGPGPAGCAPAMPLRPSVAANARAASFMPD